MIGYILLFLLVLLLLLPAILISFIKNIMSLFGIGREKNGEPNGSGFRGTGGGDGGTDVKGKKSPGRKKIFDKNEGEYVDFEEIE